jgi:hypothetical protein
VPLDALLEQIDRRLREPTAPLSSAA